MASASSPPVGSPNGTDMPAPTRIKRNTACVRCRDAKVRCNASLNPSQPCLRCSKLDLDCVVDKGHKRTSKRSKLEELAAELRNIKEAVVGSGPSAVVSPAVAPPLRPTQLQSPAVSRLPYISPVGIGSTYSTPPTSKPSFGSTSMPVDPQTESPIPSPNFIAQPRPAGQAAEPRALASSVFSGEDIDYYFEKYFEHFHPFMPIVRIRDPDACYKSAPVLFWAIICTACRRYAKRESTFHFLVNAITSEVWSAVASVPVRPPVITALLILSTWSLPNIRFMTDPSYVYTGIALNACLFLGLHTGKGSYLEFTTPRYEVRVTDEEATYMWAASNILSQRTASYLGFSSTAVFTGKSLRQVMDGTSPYFFPRSFMINLVGAKYSSGMLNALTAGMDGPGVSHHVVEQMEEDWVKLQRSLHDGTPDIDEFMLRSTLLEVQVLYWMPLSGCGDETLRRSLMRTYSTSESLIKLALDLERKSGFLSHAPHYVFRSILLAACVVVSYLRSAFSSLIPVGEEARAIQDTKTALKTCSVQQDDLCIRGHNMLEAYWSFKDRLPPWDTCHTAKFKHRFGASIVYDCLGRWKKDLEATRASAGDPTPAGGPSDSYSSDTHLGTVGQNADLGMSDPLFRGIDWGSFMDDFEWNFSPSLGEQPDISS